MGSVRSCSSKPSRWSRLRRLPRETRSSGLDPSVEHRLLFREDAVHLRHVRGHGGSRELGLDRAELVVERGDVRPTGEHPRLGGPVVAFGVLLEVAHGDSAPADDLALVHVLGATNDPEHRRLAGPVRADDPDPRAVGHHEVDPLEHGPRAVRLVHPDEADDGHLSDEAYGTARPPPRTPRVARGVGRRPRSILRTLRAPADPLGAAELGPTTHGSRRRRRATRPRGPDVATPASVRVQPQAAVQARGSPPRAVSPPTASTGPCRSSPPSPPRPHRPRPGGSREPRRVLVRAAFGGTPRGQPRRGPGRSLGGRSWRRRRRRARTVSRAVSGSSAIHTPRSAPSRVNTIAEAVAGLEDLRDEREHPRVASAVAERAHPPRRRRPRSGDQWERRDGGLGCARSTSG